MLPHSIRERGLPLPESPHISLPALLDLLDALEPDLAKLPPVARLWAEELRRELVAHLEAPL